MNAYHEDFFIPGISPIEAISLKQILQIPKSRIKARLRPHLQQRLIVRVEYLGFFNAFTTNAFLGILFFVFFNGKSQMN